jgi:putative transposase
VDKKSQTNQLYRKQQNIIKQLHYDTINFYISNFNYILLPKFETQDMVSNKNKLGKESKRELSQLQHYKFQQRLLAACNGLPNCKVIIVSEAYSTRECSNCGHLNPKLKLTERTFNCKQCNYTVDRDDNSSRNIYLRPIQV